MYLFGSLWSRWQLAFKVVTPILHVAFSAAQVHGSVILWKMYRTQYEYIKETVLVEEVALGIEMVCLEPEYKPPDMVASEI